MRKKAIMIVLLVLCAALIAVFFAFGGRMLSSNVGICGLLPFGHDYLCFARNLDDIYKREGAGAAFAYLNAITNDLNYGASHLLAHQLGHSVWSDAEDLHAALAQIPYYEYSPTEIFRYGGVVHGIFHSYFLFNTTDDVHQLIAESCASLASKQMQALLADCVHGIGHGLMAYTNNDLPQTLSLCEESLQPINCYQGAFMEHGLLYIPGYADETRLQELGEVCDKLTLTQREACAQYAGWEAIVRDLVQKRSSQTATALHACDAYSDELRHGCIFIAARDLFSIVYKGDKDAMARACAELNDTQACIEGIAAWDAWEEAYVGVLETVGI